MIAIGSRFKWQLIYFLVKIYKFSLKSVAIVFTLLYNLTNKSKERNEAKDGDRDTKQNTYKSRKDWNRFNGIQRRDVRV